MYTLLNTIYEFYEYTRYSSSYTIFYNKKTFFVNWLTKKGCCYKK